MSVGRRSVLCRCTPSDERAQESGYEMGAKWSLETRSLFLFLQLVPFEHFFIFSFSAFSRHLLWVKTLACENMKTFVELRVVLYSYQLEYSTGGVTRLCTAPTRRHARRGRPAHMPRKKGHRSGTPDGYAPSPLGETPSSSSSSLVGATDNNVTPAGVGGGGGSGGTDDDSPMGMGAPPRVGVGASYGTA